jgi:probable poly-beta-1,6-N-acetyl-D-glucosamine export protein
LKKKIWLDELVYMRAFAILAVLTIHVTMYSNMRKIDSPLYFVNYFINDFAHFAVPIFIIVSGISLTISYAQELRFKEYFIKRITTLIPAYLFITFVYLFLFTRETLTAGEYFNRLLHGSGTTHLYFVPLIIKLYLVFPILLWLAKKVVNKVKNMTLLFGLLFLFHLLLYFRVTIIRGLDLDFLQANNVLNLLIFSRDFSYFWVYLGYFIFGIIVALKIEEIKTFIVNRNMKTILIILPIFTIVSSMVYFYSISDSKTALIISNFAQTVSIVFNYFSFIFLFKLSNIVAKKENAFFSLIKDIGNHSFAIYLYHMIFIYVLFKILPHGNVQYTNVSFYIILFTFALFGSLSISFIVNLLPIPTALKKTVVGNYIPIKTDYDKAKG